MYLINKPISIGVFLGIYLPWYYSLTWANRFNGCVEFTAVDLR